MRQNYRLPALCLFSIFASLVLTVSAIAPLPAHALTASFGHPYHGYLQNGVPFPRQFAGYVLREEDHTYTTPEVVGALLDAIDGVQKQFPGTPPVYLGDFSQPNGGSSSHHRSHQNGRDVDVGLYAKDNRALDSFMTMNEENLDVAKTWCLIEGLLRSQRVQYIFLDRRLQGLLHDYALAQGISVPYLDHLFGNSRGAIIQHVPNHVDHMHVRFYTPWSTLAAQVGNLDDQKRNVIEMAQQAYLPKKVFYYAKGSEGTLDGLAQSFGVTRRDLCRWNNLHAGEVPTPGSCLVFYKRGFEMEPVHLAQTLQPDSVPDAQYAALHSPRTLSDAAASGSNHSLRESHSRERDHRQDKGVVFSYTVRRGDTIEKIAQRNGIDPKVLSEANHLKKNSALHAGQKINLAGMKMPYSGSSAAASDSRSNRGRDRQAGNRTSVKIASLKPPKDSPTSGVRDSHQAVSAGKRDVDHEKANAKNAKSSKHDREKVDPKHRTIAAIAPSRTVGNAPSDKASAHAKPTASASSSKSSQSKLGPSNPSKGSDVKKPSSASSSKTGGNAGTTKNTKLSAKKKS